MKKNFQLTIYLLFFIANNGISQDVLATSFFQGYSPASQEVFLVKNGWSSHYVSGTMGGFNSSDKWQAMGEFTSGTYYGHRVQQSRLGLFSGFNNTQPVIQWERNSPFVSPPSLQFRYGSGNPTPSSYINIFELRYNGSGLLGTNSSGLFVYTPMFETNTNGNFAIGHAIYAPNSSAGLYVKSNPDNTYTSNTGVNVDLEVDNDLTGTGVSSNIKSIGSNNYLSGFKALVNPHGTVDTYGDEIFIEGDGENVYGSNVWIGGDYKLAFGYKGYVKSADNTYGLFSEALGNGNNIAYGIYATAANASNVYAGYFDGDVYSTGTFISSDQKLKENIVSTENAIEKLKLLKPVDFSFIQNKNRHFSKMLQHGFIAQEIEKVFPELVQNARSPITEKGKIIGYDEFKAVNYTGLISILVKGTQELSEKVEKQNETIDKLTKELQEVRASNTYLVKPALLNSDEQKVLNSKAYSLSQNLPNPFNSQTTIRYSVPANSENVMIAVFDLNGRMLLQFNNLTGNSAVTINASRLQPGMYLYSLITNGEELITKKMILTK